nr:MAG TPA: hypothetical protein [Caudoviricetes sp.]
MRCPNSWRVVSSCPWKGTTSACAENTAGQRRIRGSLGNYLRVRGEYKAIL